MGNSVSGSKDRHSDESIDFGTLVPQGVYSGPQDWNQQIVGHLIVDRKLAPFYRSLEEYDEDWDDDRILAARKENPNATPSPLPDPPSSASSTSTKFRNLHKSGKEPFRPTEASIYRGAVECPICFLYYPPNINRSRCCDQAICTECFVQIKRAEPTTTHLVSEPAACPYCVQENFGVIYEPPPWRTGLMSDVSAMNRPNMQAVSSASSAESNGSKRRKSFGADSPEVVTIDQIRPDWEAKLAAVRAAVARRANRRIIMRQVGDRLIPIGVTSGRAHDGENGLENSSGIGEGPESGRRSTRRRNLGGQDLNQILGSVGLGGLGGQDLEELMVMEAMRLSLLEHEQQQRRQANDNNDSDNQVRTTIDNGDTPASSASSSPRLSSSPSNRYTERRGYSPSPVLTPFGTPPHQTPIRSRSPVPLSPLSNGGNAISRSTALSGSSPPRMSSGALSNVISATSTSLEPPPTSRTHRRAGSSPGAQLSSTLVAALSAAHTGTALVNPNAIERTESRDRGTQNIPRSAPETRAGSPKLIEPEVHTRDGPHVVLDAPSLRSLAAENAYAPGASSSSNVTPPSPALFPGTHPSETDGDLSRDTKGYRPSTSSMETRDPLLNWDR